MIIRHLQEDFPQNAFLLSTLPVDKKALRSPHRISHRRPFDKLRDRLGFCDSPSRGE